MEINNVEIDKLSGPVNFYFLKPNIDKFNENINNGIYLPLVILFGDYHASGINKCVCDNMKYCYQIDSDDFLNLINSLASMYPVDFSIETFNIITKKLTEEEVNMFKNREYFPIDKPLGNLLNLTIPCYNHEYKNKLNCNYKNIRWQLTDIRQVYSNDIKIVYETIIYNLYKNIFDNINNKKDYDDIYNIINNIWISCYENHSFLDNILQLYNYIILDIKNKTNKYIDYYFNLDNEEFVKYSLIYKQIKKQKKGNELSNFNIWKKWFTEYYNYIIKDYVVINDIDKIYLTFHELTKIIKKSTKENILINDYIINFFNNDILILNKIKDTFFMNNLIYLDLYYITRMLKVPKNSINPVVSFGYFGAFHSQNISYFLNNIMKYYTIDSKIIFDFKKLKSIKDVVRCLKLPTFNLNKEIIEYQKICINKNNFLKYEILFKSFTYKIIDNVFNIYNIIFELKNEEIDLNKFIYIYLEKNLNIEINKLNVDIKTEKNLVCIFKIFIVLLCENIDLKKYSPYDYDLIISKIIKS
jgi:hypothetical protein